MIKITNSIETPEWRNKLPRPVITVMHSMSNLEITEFVRIAVEAGHLKAVLDGLPEGSIPDTSRDCYEVVREGDTFYPDPFMPEAGSKLSTLERATFHARALAKEKEGGYRIMKVEHVIRSWEKMEYQPILVSKGLQIQVDEKY